MDGWVDRYGGWIVDKYGWMDKQIGDRYERQRDR